MNLLDLLRITFVLGMREAMANAPARCHARRWVAGHLRPARRPHACTSEDLRRRFERDTKQSISAADFNRILSEFRITPFFGHVYAEEVKC